MEQPVTCIIFFQILLIYFWLRWVSMAGGFWLVAVSRDYSLVAVCGLLLAMASPVAEHGLSSIQAPEAVARVQVLKCRPDSYGAWA